jgi:nitrate reductase (NAD(P)H)
VLKTTEEWVKDKEDWPANIEKREKEAEAKRKEEEEEKKQEEVQTEAHWKRNGGEAKIEKHNDAYAVGGDEHKEDNHDDKDKGNHDEEQKSEYEKLRETYSPQEIALLRTLKHEKEYISNLKSNDGKTKSPLTDSCRKQVISIDEKDQFTPDNWIPRHPDLIRLTGTHPLNAEPPLTPLLKAGLITPNHLHYVRQHGAVPKLLWETHTLDVENGKLKLSMDELRTKFSAINIAVALACDGNRRKELNMVKRSKGFNWAAGAVGCSYWKGPLLRDVMKAAGVPDKMPGDGRKKYWINIAGADSPSEGPYETCIPFDYAMDPTNDVILAYEMNDVPLPPDHGYPLRIIIPGYVGGRCVKWLQKIWVSDKENDSHYHIWDNRVLPSFVTEKDGEFAQTMFRHPDTACYEQNLNSVIVKPEQGERISLAGARKGNSYRIEGYAYDGGGHEVQRVEVSLDGGQSWLYCLRKFPEAPIRHGNKFWTWLHWHVDVEVTHLLRAKSIAVRCFNVFKNTQPQFGSWNTMGMMNNGWYIVKPEIVCESRDGVAEILFRHPTEPGTGDGGWMKPSVELQVADAKQAAGAPSKQFTRQEIEKHDSEKDCWLVIDGKVYDVTSVLGWHPGGKSAILGHAGKVHQETSDEFASIHDGYAYKKLNECVLGVVTDKAKQFIKANAEAMAKELAQSGSKDQKTVLEKHRWNPVKLRTRKNISSDTREYTFTLPENKAALGLNTCQHIQLGFHFEDKMLIRSYTPTRPILANQEDGTFSLVVKTYMPTDQQPGGAMSNILDCMPIGEEIEVRGPTGDIEYFGEGKFTIEGKELHFDRVTLILGGSGITPGYALLAKIMLTDGDDTRIAIIDANKSENDILLKGEMDKLKAKKPKQCSITHVLSHPGNGWEGLSGHVDAKVIRKYGFEPDEKSVAFLCGPPGMVQKAALPALKEWGYEEETNCFGF